MKTVCLIFSLLLSFDLALPAQEFRPPAYPLVTVDPYFSIWSFNDTLYQGPTRHWTGKENSLRGIVRVDGQSYSFMGQPMVGARVVLPPTGNTRLWKATFTRPANDWYRPGFNDGSWKSVRGAFQDGTQGANDWETHDVWTRRTFNLDSTDFKHLMISISHDDGATVYLNGVLAAEASGANHSFDLVEISEAARKTLKPGANLMAIHCENTGGLAYLDAGLTDQLKPDVRIPDAQQSKVEISATQTFYTFKAGGVTLEVTFTAPLLPQELTIFSRPADYLSFQVKSHDGKPHRVQLYCSAGGNLAVNTPDQQVQWKSSTTKSLQLMRVGTVSQDVLGRKGDDVRIDWGYFYLGVPRQGKVTTVMASSAASVQNFIDKGTLSLKNDVRMPRRVDQDPVSLAAAYDLGSVSAAPVSRHLILAYDDLTSIEYFHQPLKAWWKKDGTTTHQMLEDAETAYSAVRAKCDSFDRNLALRTTRAGGKHYAKICELAYRQAMAAHKLVADPQGQPLFFNKENFSNGSIGTVDVTYPSSPVLLIYNPVLLEALMEPIFHYSESGLWKKPIAAHDVGTYPIANGQTYGEDMPVEECGNMIILSAALVRATGSGDFAKKHWGVLTTWAHYLRSKGLDPANQLCTDDFAGHLAHNANLSVKAIMGLACYGYVAGKLGMKDTARIYLDLARSFAKKWMEMDQDGDHYSLTFDKKGTWSQKYNLIWDRVLQLNIFPKSVAQTEIKYYLTKQNTYGLPLDSRKTYTKSDWIVWTATLADHPEDFHRLVEPIYKYVCETPSRVPLSDWHETTTGEKVAFRRVLWWAAIT